MNFFYNNKFKRSHNISDLIKINENKNNLDSDFYICGRIFKKRIMGKGSFIEIKDMSGKIQLFLSEQNLNNKYKEHLSHLNLGDIIGVRGNLFKTKTNELTLMVKDFNILSKNLNTFPDKRFGLTDKEVCYRNRYLDLFINEETKKNFLIRFKIIQEIRNFFVKNNYIEVETPIMQNITGGADAKPFETYNNYLNSKLYLRISPELYLKRLIVGGFEKIFEIGKNFRNEGMSNRHHPEFTSIEFYEAYSNYKDLILLTEKLFKHLIFKLKDEIFLCELLKSFEKKFRQINFYDSIIEYAKIPKNKVDDIVFLRKTAENEMIKIDKNFSLQKIQAKIFEHFVEKNLIKPTFVLHHPKEISPLSRECDENKNLVERFELYIDGKEIANGFSELNDPIEQEKRFKIQVENKNLDYDLDYINALKYALPPTAGEGIGIDRLIMLFTKSQSIKDVILFPIMKFK